MTSYERAQKTLRSQPQKWLITGCAGFIGSHLLETLLSLGQGVVGLDNFSTGKKENLAAVRQRVGAAAWRNFLFIRGDVGNVRTCQRACSGVNYVLHQAALGSVPQSVEDPLKANHSNVSGFLNILVSARDAKARRLVYASSSSVYGDDELQPKLEEKIGKPLSPYAVTKRVNELYADVFSRCYGFGTIGLRYFNVFGPRQDPNGPYAAVLPKWIAAMRQGEPIYIFGDGETSRDFCHVANVVQANILAATTKNAKALNKVFNVACGERTSLKELFSILRETLVPSYPHLRRVKPRFTPFRQGDVRHSLADIQSAQNLLGYVPSHLFRDGLRQLKAYEEFSGGAAT